MAPQLQSDDPSTALTEPLLLNQDENECDDDTVLQPPQGETAEEASPTTTTIPVSMIQTELWEMMHLGVPLLISFFCRMGMASTDSAFVGHLHTKQENSAQLYLAAATLSDMVVNCFITPSLAFNQVLNALVSQSMGSDHPKMAGVWLQHSILWLSVSMLPCLVGLWYVEPILRFLGFDEDVSSLAGAYAKFNVSWPIPNGIYQCLRFYFQAQGLPQPAMYNNLLFLFVNIVLNWIFVFGGPFAGWEGWGFVGAALSISVSRILQTVTYFLYMFLYKQHHLPTWPGWKVSHFCQTHTMEFMKQSLPNIGTLLFQVLSSQATTVLVGRLGDLSIATSSALSTVSIPWAGSLSAACSTISGVRVGYHLGRGHGNAARLAAWLVLGFLTLANVLVAVLFLSPLQRKILDIATDDPKVIDMGLSIVPALLVGTYLTLMVSNITSGVFGGQGRPFITTLLSFGLELPLSIGGVAIYILYFHGDLRGVYWYQAAAGGFELVIVLALLWRSNWQQCAEEAQRRHEAAPSEREGTLQEPLLGEASSMVHRQEDAAIETEDINATVVDHSITTPDEMESGENLEPDEASDNHRDSMP